MTLEVKGYFGQARLMSKVRKIKITLIQFPCIDGKVAFNYQTLEKFLKKIKGKTDLLLLPEMWPSGFRVLEGSTLLAQTQEALDRLSLWAKKHKTYVIGSHLTRGKGGYYNTATVIGPQGKILAGYNKVHLFQLGGENKKFLPGKKNLVLKTKIGTLGLAICYDIRFPEFIRKEVLQGAEILLIPSGWPEERIEHYRALLKVRAIENLCFVVSANRVGKNADGLQYGGHSMVVGPWGEELGELGSQTGILQVEIDLNRVKEIRKKFPVFQARREEVY